MTNWKAPSRMFAEQKSELIKCRGEGCKISWKCWRWARPDLFKGKEYREIGGINECNGVLFVSLDPQITYEGLINGESTETGTSTG